MYYLGNPVMKNPILAMSATEIATIADIKELNW